VDETTKAGVGSLQAASNYASNAAYFIEHRDELLADSEKGWTPATIDEHIGSLIHAAETLLDYAKDKLPHFVRG
jgi:hypothetical protein